MKHKNSNSELTQMQFKFMGNSTGGVSYRFILACVLSVIVGSCMAVVNHSSVFDLDGLQEIKNPVLLLLAVSYPNLVVADAA